MISIYTVELVDEQTGKILGYLDWSAFQKGMADGRYLITNHTIDFESCTGKIRQTLQVVEVEQFDLVKEWENRNSQLLKCRLSDYDVFLRYDDGLLMITDKGVLVSIEKFRKALNILYVPRSEIPYVLLGLGDCAVENAIVVNMTKLMEVIEEYKCC